MNFVDAMKLSLEGKYVVRNNRKLINNAFRILRLYVKDKDSNWGEPAILWEAEGWKETHRPDYYSLSIEDYLADDYCVVRR